MLYIEDADDDLWLDLVEVLGERELCDMVLCLYPGSDELFPRPFVSTVVPESLERVTQYPDGDEPPCSERASVSADLLGGLRSCTGEFEDWGDSLLLYPPRDRRWLAAFIPHRRVALVRDGRLREFLAAAGITASVEPPLGWEPREYLGDE